MKIKIIVPLFVLLVIVSCKKENHNDPDCRISRITKNGTQTYDFTYGSDGKLSSMLVSPDNEKTTFTYNGNTITEATTKNGSFRHRYIVTNNADGFATNILLHQNESGTDWYNQAIKYEGKRIVRNTATDSGGNDSASIHYIWEGGNPTILLNNGDTFHYDYYKEKPWQTGEWRNIQQFIAGYKLYEYQNLFKSSEINGNITYYTYLFDASGRISEATATKNITTTYTLEYECK